MITLYTGGTFDLFHYGHVSFLKKCASISDRVVVGLNTDDFVERFKRKPIMSFKERALSLQECRYVDEVVENTYGENSKPTILEVNPDIIAIGSDWATKDYYKQMDFDQEWLDCNGIMMIYIPYNRDISTTKIKNRIQDV